MVTGAVMFVAGLVIQYATRLPRLPGDILIERPHLTVYVPLGTMILLSVVLTLLLNILLRR
jgi:hypothetical protein